MPFFLLCEHLRILALTIHPFCASFLGTDVNGDFGNPDHFPPKNVVFFLRKYPSSKNFGGDLVDRWEVPTNSFISKKNIYHRENRGTLGMVPLIFSTPYTPYIVGIYWVFSLWTYASQDPNNSRQQTPLRSPSPTPPVLMTWTSGSSDPSSSKRASPGKTSGVITWRKIFWFWPQGWVGFLESELRTCFFWKNQKKSHKKFVKIETDDIFQVHLQKSVKPSGEIHWNPGKVWFHLKVLRANQAYITLGYKKKGSLPHLKL